MHWGKADNLGIYLGGGNDRTWPCGLTEDRNKRRKTTPGVCLPHRALKLEVKSFIFFRDAITMLLGPLMAPMMNRPEQDERIRQLSQVSAGSRGKPECWSG